LTTAALIVSTPYCPYHAICIKPFMYFCYVLFFQPSSHILLLHFLSILASSHVLRAIFIILDFFSCNFNISILFSGNHFLPIMLFNLRDATPTAHKPSPLASLRLYLALGGVCRVLINCLAWEKVARRYACRFSFQLVTDKEVPDRWQ
jgi:hypothetical protein